MNKKILNNLNALNKIILQNINIFDEDIDLNFFEKIIIDNVNFIFSSLNEIWLEFLRNYEVFEKENFIKSYYFAMKRFQKLLYKIVETNEKNNNFKKNIEEIKKNISFNMQRFVLIRENKFKPNLLEENQLINEEEYNILFKDKGNQ